MATQHKQSLVTIEGYLYVLPYSKMAELVSDTGLSVFWFDRSLLKTAVLHNGLRVKATYDNALCATRRVLGPTRSEEVVQLVSIKPIDPARKVPKEHLSAVRILCPEAMCWQDGCRLYAKEDSTYCEHHKSTLEEESI